MKTQIVLQGETNNFTNFIIEEYSKLFFIDNIILSTYKNEFLKYNCEVVLNEIINPNGTGNRNLQINTSRNGIKKVCSDFCIKMRTDQFIHLDSMIMMYNFYKKNYKKKRIFVMGMYKNFPYHPRDHVFWGEAENLKELFDIPFDMNSNLDQDYRYKTRAETYIGQFYYSKFDKSINNHIENPLTYTVDLAPKKNEALEKDFSIRDNVFFPFPRVNMEWPKHNLKNYHYDIGAMHSEYWGKND